MEAILCWLKPSSVGGVVRLQWGLPRDARASCVRGAIGLQWPQTLGRAVSGRPRQALCGLAEAHAPQDPTFRTTLAYTRLTATAALAAMKAQGYGEEQLPSPSTMAEVLNRLGFRLRKVVKAKPQKKIAETDAIFANIEKKTRKSRLPQVSNA